MIAIVAVWYFVIYVWVPLWFMPGAQNTWPQDAAQTTDLVNIDVTPITLEKLESDINRVAKSISPAVVSIVVSSEVEVSLNAPFWFQFNEQSDRVFTQQQQSGGTWVIISSEWIIITNKHVAYSTEAEYTIILNDNRQYNATLLATDPTTDLAYLKVVNPNEVEFTVASFVPNRDTLDVGDFVIAVWNALAEFQNSVTFWVISAFWRSIIAWGDGGEWTALYDLIQTDTAINPWNSGWPLVNIQWEVIGINTAVAQGNGIWFAIPMTQDRINRDLIAIKSGRELSRAMLWVVTVPLNSEIAESYGLLTKFWAYIPRRGGSIVAGSWAETSWLQWGDIITHVDGNRVLKEYDLRWAILSKQPWDILNLEVVRNTETLEFTVELGSWEG